MKNSISFRRCLWGILMAGFLSGIFVMSALASEGNTVVEGLVYVFEDSDSHYEISESEESASSSETDTYGEFSISGEISDISDMDGIPSYTIADGDLSFYYNYSDSLLTAEEDSWHLVSDKTKKVDGETMDSKIKYGAIRIEISNDQLNWTQVDYISNVFEDIPVSTESIYTTEDVQLLNGCYYRVTIVYELEILTSSGKILFVNNNKYEYKKCAEVYEFYASYEDTESDSDDSSQTYSLGSKVLTAKFNGYYGEKALTKSDIHYGWDIGNFFVSGYTDEVTESDGNVVFLKNVGDTVTLWFNLQEDIDAIQGDSSLTITADTEGYDQYFETDTMNFGRGTLIIRYTDYNNVTEDPVIYTNYLEANASVGADTKVQLFEEGDYEVALDYEVTSDGILDTTHHYRIFFTFSVRNGNCMVYPFDVVTGEELTNSSMTENGFRLDLANSRYLTINLKREVLKDSADGLVEDTRFNGPAQDGAEYTDEGIYTITVSNEYTGQSTTKKIYVGTDDVLRCYVTTGLSISEINDLVAEGAVINEDGTISLAETAEKDDADETSAEDSDNASADAAEESSDAVPAQENNENTDAAGFPLPILLITVTVIVIILLIIICTRSRRKKKPDPLPYESENEDYGFGGDEE